VEIVLNVKGITAKLYSQGAKSAIIDVAGSREVTAGDIICDSDIEILNPDHHIATVAEGGRLHMELTFNHGRGYATQDKNKQDYLAIAGPNVGAPVGMIFIDSIFTPVYSVSYN